VCVCALTKLMLHILCLLDLPMPSITISTTHHSINIRILMLKDILTTKDPT